jgi:ubiquinone/menaquinone biosynthesis C-methylase UbiE
MPTIEWNRQRWGSEYHWSVHGDEWSHSFGSAAAHWYAFILPRLHRFLPNAAAQESRIVEIAPGHGRWTQFLLGHCKRLTAYDISESCLTYCRQRFSDSVESGAAEFRLTNGLTLSESDDSVDLAFSFDSLVHVERDVMRSYLAHLQKCLKPGGFAFLQHSNLGAYPLLHNYKSAGPYNCRGTTVSTDTMQADANERGLLTLVQEGLNHETQHMNNELIDCISVIQKPIRWDVAAKTVVLSNRYYPAMGEITKAFIRPYEICEAK